MPLLRMSTLPEKSPSQLLGHVVAALIFSSARVSRHRSLPAAMLLFFVGLAPTPASGQLYAGVLGGVSTLSGDARSLITPESSAFSSYDPKNGAVVAVLLGRHFSDYFSAQASYIWNRNDLTLTAANFNNGMQLGYQEQRSSSQQSLIGDIPVYFRRRNSRLRPYLSVGTGFVHFVSTEERLAQVLGSPVLPPQRFRSDLVALHVPVGIDVSLRKGWAFRYTFSETLTQNPVSDRLSPPGQHTSKNFQNLFGFIRRF
jgi:Outer membrane protein beta-barrel domain